MTQFSGFCMSEIKQMATVLINNCGAVLSHPITDMT